MPFNCRVEGSNSGKRDPPSGCRPVLCRQRFPGRLSVDRSTTTRNSWVSTDNVRDKSPRQHPDADRPDTDQDLAKVADRRLQTGVG